MNTPLPRSLAPINSTLERNHHLWDGQYQRVTNGVFVLTKAKMKMILKREDRLA